MLQKKSHKTLTPDINKALDEVLNESAQRLSKITGLSIVESITLLTSQYTRKQEAAKSKKYMNANLVTADESQFIAQQFA